MKNSISGWSDHPCSYYSISGQKLFFRYKNTPRSSSAEKRQPALKQLPAHLTKQRLQNCPKAKVMEIAEMKMPDLNAANVEAAYSMICGTARSMGIVVEE